MKSLKLTPSDINKVLSENLNKNPLFVFSTDVVMNSWIDWCITNPQESGTEALPFEYFTAWDSFKSQYLGNSKEGYNVVPSIIRKLFICDLIEKNAQKPKEERFQSIINPDDAYAKNADTFADWLCKALPSLHFWKKRIDQNPDYGELDAEDKDYLYLYESYKAFLEKNKLFEPAWSDCKDLSILNDEKRPVFIFYPEILDDFLDFKELLSKAENLTIFTLPENLSLPKAYTYPDSRSELRKTILRLEKLVNEGKADWSEIALSIPDIETYRPYLERELGLYGIPYVIRAGEGLTKNCAGKIFREISDCYNSNFNFESLRALLLDHYLPWKDSVNEVKEMLIEKGCRMRCISESGNGKDIWLSAINSKLAHLEHSSKADAKEQIEAYTKIKDFYQKIKYLVSKFFDKCEFGNSFAHIRSTWMEFKNYFLKEDKAFAEDANNILSRCIKELDKIIQLEESFKACNFSITSPYNFFLQELDKKTYTKQSEKSGISIYPYKLSAAASIKYQFVIDASQKNLNINYKRLSFLNTTKRSKLHLLDEDKTLSASDAFIKLYAKDNKGEVVFSTAEDTFSGFAIPHSSLLVEEDKNLYEDKIILERDMILNGKSYNNKLTAWQKEGFEKWKNAAERKELSDTKLPETIKKAIEEKTNNSKATNINKVHISPRGDLELFFPCPRKWLLKAVLKLHDDSLDTELMQTYDMGNLNHTIMELFMTHYLKSQLPYYDKTSKSFISLSNGDSTEEIKKLLYEDITKKAILSQSSFNDAPLVIQTLLSQTEAIADIIFDFLTVLLLPYGGKLNAKGKISCINGIGNCTVAGVEHNEILEKDDYCYSGFIDCLLISPDDNYIIIDYKNTKNALPAQNNMVLNENSIIKDFQMSLYYKLILKDPKNEIDAGYFYAINDKTNSCFSDKYTTKTLDSLRETLAETDLYASIFTEKIKSGNWAAFTPHSSGDKKDKLNLSEYSDCIKCPFKSICRTTYVVGGKSL